MPDRQFDPILKSPKGNPLKAFVSIDWSGDVAAKLISAVKRMGDYEPLLRTIGRKLVGSIKRNFLEQRTPEGARWAPLKRSRGRGRNPSSRALFDSGRLYDDIQYSIDGPDEVSIGYTSEAFYGRFHQSGTRFIPQRRFLGVRDGDLPELGVEVETFAGDAFEAA